MFGTKEKLEVIATIRSLRHLLNKQKELDSFGVEKMRLWAIQTKETWTRAENSGVLECTDIDADKDIDNWFRPAYDWRVRQLEQRVRNYPHNKYPIRPEYHNRLFTDYQPRQPTLSEFGGELIIEGNTIKKAYLSHSRIRKMSEGDILLFYRSVDERRITSLGVIEKVYHNLRNPDEIIRYVGKRSVYTKKEIEEIAKNPTKVILFRQHFHLRTPLALDYLITNNILSGAPQSIVRISHEKYLVIKGGGGINERFTIN